MLGNDRNNGSEGIRGNEGNATGVIEQGDSITAGISAKSERSGFTGAAQANGASKRRRL